MNLLGPIVSRTSRTVIMRSKTRTASSIAINLEPSLQFCKHSLGNRLQLSGLQVQEHHLLVPLSYSQPDGEKISLFVRELGPQNVNLPYLIYLQGGPGFEAPRPLDSSGWIGSALQHFRVLLMDQRGTGLSSPLTASSIVARGGSADEQALFCGHFRADNIVRDCETIRALVCEGHQLSVLGQSFGGFCAATYLSMHPEGLREVLLTGGLPPVLSATNSADEVYSRLVTRVMAQNQKYYKRFPMDVERARMIIATLLDRGGSIKTPGGNLLTPRSFQLLGLHGLGMSGGFERLHYLIESSLAEGPGRISYSFLKGFDSWLSFDTNPVYAILHEAIYCQGGASLWSAQRLRDTAPYRDLFDAPKALAEGREILFTGEMVFPFMFDEFENLKPLKGVAEALARRCDWPRLYDTATLRQNDVPSAAVSYLEDMYVDSVLAEQTAKEIRGLRVWVTSEYMHSGIRDDGQRIFERLLGMARGSIPLF